jgi:hypothetical protein
MLAAGITDGPATVMVLPWECRCYHRSVEDRGAKRFSPKKVGTFYLGNSKEHFLGLFFDIFPALLVAPIDLAEE